MSGLDVTVSGGTTKNSAILTVGPGFFSTMQVPVLRGREIDRRDRAGSPYAAVVNQEFVRLFFGREDPMGRHVRLKGAGGTVCPDCDFEIVGVVANTLYGQLRGSTFAPAGPPPTIFFSYFQAIWGPLSEVTYELKTAGDPLGAANAVRDIVRRADPRVPIVRLKTQRALIEAQMNQEITFARLCTAFAVLALTIACIGLYGTMSYRVARQTTEIGIRMALGAQQATVVWMVLREVVTLGAIGVAIGVPAALFASKLVESFLYGMKRNDPLALVAAVLTMAAATIVAGYLPARSASRIDPMVALRHE